MPPDDPNDFTDKYNTQLSSEEEAKFQDWAKANPKLGNTYDYDARGFFQAGANAAGNGHGSDQWKKPNHPTFSDQSQYSGVGGNVGGHWNKAQDGTWDFTPGSGNVYSSNELQNYFSNQEQGNRLYLVPVYHQPEFDHDLIPVDHNPFEGE